MRTPIGTPTASAYPPRLTGRGDMGAGPDSGRKGQTMQAETVYTDERFDGLQIRWSGGATFNIWVQGQSPRGYHGEGGWYNSDCFTHYSPSKRAAGRDGEAPTPEEAEAIAARHFDEMAAEPDA
ncbi:MAG: hypothetical protein ABIH03_02320 [Pseudomonadota bacterium]